MKPQKVLLLTWKKAIWIVVAWVAAVLLHALVYGLFKDFFDKKMGGDEPFLLLLF